MRHGYKSSGHDGRSLDSMRVATRRAPLCARAEPGGRRQRCEALAPLRTASPCSEITCQAVAASHHPRAELRCESCHSARASPCAATSKKRLALRTEASLCAAIRGRGPMPGGTGQCNHSGNAAAPPPVCAGGSHSPDLLRGALTVSGIEARLHQRAGRLLSVERAPAAELRAPPLLAARHRLIRVRIARHTGSGRCTGREQRARDDREERCLSHLLHDRYLSW